MHNMKPTQAELCQALVIVGSEYAAIDDVRSDTLHRLAELGLIHWNAGEWWLSDAGVKLFPKLSDGHAIADLT
jgi:hypothetical protein